MWYTLLDAAAAAVDSRSRKLALFSLAISNYPDSDRIILMHTPRWTASSSPFIGAALLTLTIS